MARLRGPDGCSWDREQNLASLKPYLLEEAHELLEAIDHGDPVSHCEELGDLLLQVVFQAQICRENAAFDICDVCEGIADKLVRRHPYVFGEGERPSGSEAHLRIWQEVKESEKPQRESILDGVPKSLPALHRAQRVGEIVAAVGFDWPSLQGALDKVAEEWRELRDALDGDLHPGEVANELGDLLFSVVNVARHARIGAEEALHRTIVRFGERFRYVEATLKARGQKPANVTLDHLNGLWEDAKKRSGL